MNMFMKDFDKFFVGFEPLMKRISDNAEQALKLAATNYPPYNIKKIDENKYVIEMAVAGFGRQDLELELEDSKLIIRGNIKSGEPAEQDSVGDWTWPQVLYQGLAMRPFTRTFTLNDNVEISNAELINGILRIVLDYIIPEQKKTTKIKIEEGS
jgi:molecular chaperone IbpA